MRLRPEAGRGCGKIQLQIQEECNTPQRTHRKTKNRTNPLRKQGESCVAMSFAQSRRLRRIPTARDSRKLFGSELIRGLGKFTGLREKSGTHNALADAPGLYVAWNCGILPHPPAGKTTHEISLQKRLESIEWGMGNSSRSCFSLFYFPPFFHFQCPRSSSSPRA